MTLSMFKETDQIKANNSLNEYDLNMMQGATAMLQGDFKIAAQHYRNIANALDNLQSLKNERETLDQVVEAYKQIRHQGQKI
ncbi:hypothetical protein [Oceanobacillus profundus]|uniref:hypothetical protein n=1 Tax=Oceanobacillus profundus TaxID=372463 RepID=UPI0026E49244|nr:hypothetical protein [Oceanobacillus profundus]MDO6451885.1 hypothetical protein [Oceanobacillus profundus]